MNTIKARGDCKIGTVKGVAQRNITNRSTGETSVITELGLSRQTIDDFGDVQDVQERIVISRGLIEKGHVSKFAALKGKDIIIPVWYRAYSTKSGAGVTAYLPNDWESTYYVLPQSAPVSKVG